MTVHINSLSGLKPGDEVFEVLHPRTGDVVLTKRRPGEEES